MSGEAVRDWQEANKLYLAAAIEAVRGALELRLRPENGGGARCGLTGPADERERARASVPGMAALDLLVGNFGLSAFERDVLVLCAGLELDAKVAALCLRYHADAARRAPTFGLALDVLADSHWSALTPDGPLRYWRLIEIGPGDSLTASPLRIDERILHYLAGAPHLDERLRGVLWPVNDGVELCPSHQGLAERVAGIWRRCRPGETAPVIQLCGADRQTLRAVAGRACRECGWGLLRLPAGEIPAGAAERTALIRLVERETVLSNASLLVECDEAVESDRTHPVLSFINSFRNMLVVGAREPVAVHERAAARFDVGLPPAAEQRAVWMQSLGGTAARRSGQIDRLLSRFRLSGSEILRLGAEILRDEGGSGDVGEGRDAAGTDLWDFCRARLRPRFDNLAVRIRATARWDDLVVPELQKQILRELLANVRQQARVYEDWGFAERSSRGLGISALFHGPSGTGKTLAAEVLANELRLDLYRIDLSSVVSKYIGETEKNLRRVFETAEQGGLILLFDEADALFGKRSEVRDSHDRYSNIEVSYLLQRMEAYRGLAILTTNDKGALDPAFLRRLRFVVQFPFPDMNQREEIWKRVFPGRTPRRNLDERKLARLNVAGGNIRNIALNAAFLAADEDRPVTMADIRNAAATEYTKIDKSLSAAETRDWV